jgi:hypothetical protein
VGEAVAEMIGQPGREDLRLGFEAAKGLRVYDTVPIALERIAIRVIEFRVSAPPALPYRKPNGA